MIIRPATSDDLPRLRAWDNAGHVIAAFGATDRFDWRKALIDHAGGASEILIGEAGGRPVGAVILTDLDRETPRRFRGIAPRRRAIDLWVGAEADLEQGYGKGMLRLALARSFADHRVRGVIGAPIARAIRARTFLYRQGFAEHGRVATTAGVRILYEMPRGRWAGRE